MATLKRKTGSESFPISDEGETIIGRGEQATLRLDENTMSRTHARILAMNGRYVLSDLGSSNGTAVDGKRISGPTEIKHGMEVQFGSAFFIFQVEAAQPKAAAPQPQAPAPPVAPPAAAASPKETPAKPPPAAAPPAEKAKAPEKPAEVPAAKPAAAAGKPPGKGGVANLFAAPKPGPKPTPEPAPAAEAAAVAPVEVPSDQPDIRRIKAEALKRSEAAREAEEKKRQKEAEVEEEAEAGPTKFKKPPNRRRKCPTILQMEAVECGAAALAIILGYYKKIVPLEELRVECGVSRDGSKASNVLRAARKYGLEAKGYKYEELDKLYDLDLPVILFWNFNHFLALEGFKGGKVHLMDPAMGPRIITMEELDASFSGVVLTFKPAEDFKKGGAKRSILPSLGRRLRGSEMALAFAVFCGLFLVVPGLIVPTFSRIFIDEVLVSGRTSIIKPLLAGMGVIAAIQMGLKYLQEYYLLRMETRLSLKTSALFFNHILRLPVTYFGQRFAGEIGSRVMINDRVATIISGRLATTVLDCLLIVFYATLMFIYSVPLTLACIGLALLNVIAVRLASRKRIDAARRQLQEGGKLTDTAMNGLQTIETLKATGSETEFFGRWAAYQTKTLKAEQDLGVIGLWVNSVPSLVGTLISTTILLFGGLLVMRGSMSIGMLVAYQTLMGSFVKPLNTFVSFGSEVQELEGDMNRLDDVLEYPQDKRYSKELKVDERTRGMVKLSGQVELRNVTFGYSPLDKPLVENFDLSIKPGQRVALVGGSGSGKSTVAKLITGLYELWTGEILLDGIKRDELPPDLLSNSMSCVDQDVFLFGGTIRDNITMWDSTIPVARMTQAAKDAAIDSVIETRDGAYQSVVEEGGGNFSGGQRQRLEISRALVAEPTILILDEATSALDTQTESMIDSALRRRGCTCIIVAHRLSTIRDCDEIVVLHKGKIVQRGTHDQLKDQPGHYSRLIHG